jgi:hypothetical protein
MAIGLTVVVMVANWDWWRAPLVLEQVLLITLIFVLSLAIVAASDSVKNWWKKRRR